MSEAPGLVLIFQFHVCLKVKLLYRLFNRVQKDKGILYPPVAITVHNTNSFISAVSVLLKGIWFLESQRWGKELE